MADTVEKGITIQFRGDTADFDKSVKTINKELKESKSEVSLLNKELKFDANNITKLTGKFEELKKQQKLINEELDAYKSAMSTMDKNSAQYQKASQEARKLELQLSYVNDQIDKMGGNKVSVALNAVGKAFTEVGDKVTALGKKFTALSGTATAVLTGFGKLAYDTVQYADTINTLAKQTGLSTDALQTFDKVAELIDVDLNTISKSAIYLTKNLENKTALDTYKKLGVAVKDANGNYKATDDILIETLGALQKVGDETERNLLASKLFGKSYSNLGSIINSTDLDLEALTAQIKESGAVLSGDQLNALNGVNDSIDTLKMRFGALGTSLVADFQDPLTSLMEKVTALADRIIKFVNGLSGEQKEKILQVIVVIASIAPILITLGALISGIGTAITTVSQTVSLFSKGLEILNGLNPFVVLAVAVGALIYSLVELYNKNEDFRNAVNRLGDYLKDTFTAIVNTLQEAITGALDAVSSAISTVVDWLKSAYDWVVNLVSAVKDLFSSGFSKIGSFVGGIFSSGGFGNVGAFASGGYGTLEMQTTININNNGANINSGTAQLLGKEIVDYVNNKLGRRI